MKNIKVLLVEDDHNLGQILKEFLDIKGYATTLFKDGHSGLRAYHTKEYDVCLLDVMLPKMDGFSVAAKIRETDTGIPIIFLTAKSMKEDTLEGFKIGADDYLTKPFSMEELLVRMEAILRRIHKTEELEDAQNDFQIGGYSFEYDSQRLIFGEISQKLTSKEAELLKQLCLHKNQVLDRSKALKKLWHNDSYFNARSMDVYITKLRKYLRNDSSIEIINVHGQGFKLLVL
jgi:DNA-binding response OmpR family regulator